MSYKEQKLLKDLSIMKYMLNYIKNKIIFK